mmetsp:Transcript_4101/g.9124  ORF Transcript_4101/g.9124 Transcript_4101/m.9124 type:complete len:342 (+) Transcript_4101:442-1467(+)
MSRNIQHVVHTPSDPDETILITATSISSKVVPRIRFHVHIEIALVISQTRTSHSRPRLFDCQNSLCFRGVDFLSSCRVQDNHLNTVACESARARFHWCDTRQVGNDMASRLRLPISINHSTVALSDDIKIPLPSSRIDWLSNRTQHLQRRQIVFFRSIITEPHQTTNRSGGGIKDSNLVTLHHIPVTTVIWIHWSGLEHEGRDTIQKRTVDDVGVSSNPSCIGNARIHIFVRIVGRGRSSLLRKSETVGSCMHCINRVSSSSMKESLWPPSTSRRVQDEQWVLSIHPFTRTHRSLCLNQLCKPHMNIFLLPLIAICPSPIKYKHLFHHSCTTFLRNCCITN